MKKIITLIAIMLFSCAMFANAQSQGNTPFVEVRGFAERDVEPNKIEVVVSLNEADSKGKISLDAMEKKFETALKQANVDIKNNVVVVNQSSAASKRQQAFQYKTYQVTVTNAQEVDALFAAFETNGVLNAQISKYWNSDYQKIQEQMKIEAVKDAKATATILATALGQQVGRALQIIDNEYPQRPFDTPVMIRGTKAMSADSNSILTEQAQIKKVNMRQNITVRFELK